MTTTKHLTQKIHANKIHGKLSYPGEDSMRATAKQIHYIVKGVLEDCEELATTKNKHKYLHTVAEERNLKLGEMIYLEIISQKIPSYEGSKNWVIIQDLDTKQKWYLFRKAKEYLTVKSPFS